MDLIKNIKSYNYFTKFTYYIFKLLISNNQQYLLQILYDLFLFFLETYSHTENYYLLYLLLCWR